MDAHVERNQLARQRLGPATNRHGRVSRSLLYACKKRSLSMGKLTYNVVGFLDVLGYAAMVKHDAEAQEEKFLPTILSIFETLAEAPKPKDMDIRMFSDSIIVMAPLSPDNFLRTLEICTQIQRLFLEQKIPIRGGISFGKHFSDKNLIFSDSLVKAYRIETTIARFPRVAIDHNALNYAWHDPSSDESLREKLRQLVAIDRDGVHFVDYLGRDSLLSAEIEVVLKRDIPSTETVLEKMRWLYDYHNHCAIRRGLPPLNMENLVGGFIQLTDIA